METLLITDRTQADVDALKSLLSKGVQNMTPAELNSFNNNPHKGGYNYTDYNRVGEAVAELAEVLDGFGYHAEVTSKSDWTENDNIKPSDRAAYLADLNTLKDVFYGTTTLPSAWEGITFEDANNAEKLLIEIALNVISMQASFIYCGEAYCGEV